MGCVQSSPNQDAVKRRKLEIQRMKKEVERKNHQILLLQKQNNQLKKKKVLKAQDNNQQIRINDVEIIELQQDGKNQDTRDGQNQLKELLKCTLCEQEYNLKIRIPWMVCVNQHTYCNDCMSRMIQRNQSKCPQCRQQILTGNRNLHLCMLLQHTNKKDSKKRDKSNNNNSSVQQLNITVNKSNRYYDQYVFFPPNVIMKGKENVWYGLLFNEVLPVEGRYRFCAELIYSLHNNFQIGIIDLSSKVQKGKMSNKRITFHLYDGKVMDSGNVDSPITGWRVLGEPVPKGSNCKVIVQINMDDNEIKWIINDKVHAETVVTNYLKYAKAVPYISMYHTDDVVNINTW